MNKWAILKGLKKNYPAWKGFIVSWLEKKNRDKEYDHVLKIWNKFEMKTIKDDHNLYLKCDVLLLADVFERCKNNSLKNYGLCPSQYLSAPALSWDAMLNMTKVELELIPDPDMYILFEKGTRGEVSYISNGYSKSNSKFLKSFDPKIELKRIIYLDTNNLYGYAMSKFLPTSGTKRVDHKGFDLKKYINDSSKECVLKVDLEYLKELIELHHGYPWASDNIDMKRKMLYNYQLKIADLNNISFDNVKKLVSNFFDKEKYVLHYTNLQLYLRLGLILKKHRSLEFNQSYWLKKSVAFSI